ncbi:hypothetical protein GCM10009789_60320 [Kribbella sancticallisti]|uniref:Translation elongation factor EFTu-like domain-containing protein n=1 Tax=Kribbella sancticallisti TaxID=460087 RepID=A0ABP4Q1K3_9ACTN
MGWKFWKREPNPMDPQQLLNQAHAGSPDRPQDGRPDGPHDRADRAPDRPQDGVPVGVFLLTVEDVFSITGRGTVVTGRVTAGMAEVGDQVTITRAGLPIATSRITGVEAFRKTLTAARAGENVGLLLEGVARDQVLAGDVISR